KAGDQGQAAHDLEHGDGGGERLGHRHAQLGESPDALVDVNELQYPLPEEDPSRHHADDHRRARSRHRRMKNPSPYSLDHATTPLSVCTPAPRVWMVPPFDPGDA